MKNRNFINLCINKISNRVTQNENFHNRAFTKLSNWMAFIAIFLSVFLGTSQLRADSGIPTGIVTHYDHVNDVLTISVTWSWNNPSDMAIGAAVFADLNGDGLTPTFTDDPASWMAPGLLIPSDEFLGQLATSGIEGTASSTVPFSDATDTGLASGVAGFTTSTPRVLFPYGLMDANDVLLATYGGFTLTYTNVTVAPAHICVILYNVHTGNNQTTITEINGPNSPVSADNSTAASTHNNDNSVEAGFGGTTVSCTDAAASTNLVDLELDKSVSNATPMIGDHVTFTLVVTNTSSNEAAGVEVTDVVPSGLSYDAATITIVGPATGTTDDSDPSGSGLTWSDLTIPANGMVTLTFQTEITGTGMITNSAEITVSPPDEDSTPDNNEPDEDDQDDACVSVPLPLCPGDSYTLSAPSGLTSYQWQKDNVDINPGGDQQTLIVTIIGSYTFMALDINNCPVDSECPAIFNVFQAATCNLNDINEVGCIIPTAFTDPNDVFSGIEACGALVTMTNADVGDTDMCGDGDGADFTRTYSLLFDGIEFTTCAQDILISPSSVNLTCPVNATELSCQTQGDINTAFAVWLATASVSGGCNTQLSNNNIGAPDACGGTATVTFTASSDCEADVTCMATFSVEAPAPLSISCSNSTEGVCQTQDEIDTAFANWLASASASGGCNVQIINNNTGAPSFCGGSETVIFTATSDCEADVGCLATFTVTAAPAVSLTCPNDATEAACQTQGAIDAAFALWLNGTAFSGGCNAMISDDNTGAPLACGGSTVVTWTVASDCEADVTCSATFTVTAAPAISLTCPDNATEAACQTQGAVDAAFALWLDEVAFSGGCNASISNNNSGAPLACGGSTEVTWTVVSACEMDVTCSATFTVTTAPAVSLTCPNNVTEAACQTQGAVDAAFALWLDEVAFSGGCNASINNNNSGAPLACGGSTEVTWTVASDCEADVTCSATFTVTAAPVVSLTCPNNTTEISCQTQDDIDAAFALWLDEVVFSGGCNAMISNDNTGAPLACGGSTQVTWTVMSDCEANVTCSATFTVTAAPAVSLTCPNNATEVSCQTQGAIDAAFVLWIDEVVSSGGCNAMISNDNTGAPLACGGSTQVTWTVMSDCEANVTCSSTFTVTAAPAVSLTCPNNATEVSCQSQGAIDAAFALWLDEVVFSGGCNAMISNDNSGAPLACGGSTQVTWTVMSDCETNVTCSATFTVTAAPAVSLTCPNNATEVSCQSQGAIDAAFALWLDEVVFSGGCNAMISNDNSGAPLACGGSTEVTWTVVSACEVDVTCSATFTVTAAPAVSLTCPNNATEAACQAQATIDIAFAFWLNEVVFSGGCNAMISDDNTGAPLACGGSTVVTWTVTSDCEADVTCSATFTVTAAPAVSLTCPNNATEAACQTQNDIDAAFALWLDEVSFSGGCNAMISNDNSGAPLACGGSTEVTWTVVSACEVDVTCSATFTVTAAPAVSLTCPDNATEAACQTQNDIDAAFALWLNTVSVSGGCNTQLSDDNTGAPNACGGSSSVTWTASSDCEADVTCTATFTVTSTNSVNLTCPIDATEAACQTQGAIDAAFAIWLSTASVSGGFNTQLSNDNTGAPNACGGSTTVTFTATSDCEPDVTCMATFTVTAAPAVSLTCPNNATEASCQTQGAIDAAFALWLDEVVSSGGCNAMISNDNSGAPLACGGSTEVTWTVVSDCEVDVTCSATFTVTAAPAVSLTCPNNTTEASCQTQGAIDAAFALWLDEVVSSGGCNAMISNDNTGAPLACGGSTEVTWTVMSDCEMDVTCSATFTVTAAPAVSLTCPNNATEVSCQTQNDIDAAFALWLDEVVFSGGCNAMISNDNSGAPLACGGSTEVTWTVVSDCEVDVTCSATFTVTAAPAVSLTCPNNTTEASCQTQGAIDAAFALWLDEVVSSGGCNAMISNDNTGAPLACGGSTEVTWTVMSDCEMDVTCSATFTVTAAPAVSLTCPNNATEASCQTQNDIDAAFALWLDEVSFSGGCNAMISNDNSGAPLACGGSTEVTWTVVSACEVDVTCSATFTVTAAPAVNLTCPVNVNEGMGQTQAAIDAAFATWLNTVSVSGGCNTQLSDDNTGAPNACGGSSSVTWTASSDCEADVTCTATFTVTSTNSVNLTCPIDATEAACQTQGAIDAAFAIWLSTASVSGGFNTQLSNDNTGAPNACGGSTTVTFTATSDCEPDVTCMATFTVTDAPILIASCPNDVTEGSCQTQMDIDAAFAIWLGGFTTSGGCNTQTSGLNVSPPDADGGSVTVNFSATDDCNQFSNCSATFSVVDVPLITLTCSNTSVQCDDTDDGTATVVVNGGTAPYTYQWDDANNQTTATATNLAPGTYSVTVTDQNSCTSTCSTTIIVEDNTPPTAVCDDLVVSISTDPTWISAIVFDGGSEDDCGTVSFQARRMDSPYCPGDDETDFNDFVPFYCCDVGHSVTVALRVEDEAGNWNICMVDIPVDDKIDPIIDCPEDVTVDCWESTHPDSIGYATATDNCEAIITYEDNELFNNCNTGTIIRTWKATDPFGNMAVCDQTITIINSTPFTESDITWPPDVNDIGCNLPSATGEPEYSDGPCGMVAHIYSDLELPFSNGCVKIIRTWTVFDNCQTAPPNSDCPGGIMCWTYEQQISIMSTQAPEIICTSPDDFCSYDPDCETGSATLTVDATDDCESLLYMYKIDFNNDGSIDIQWTEDFDGSVTDDFELGTHKIYWKVYDGCGNVAECNYLFTIKDCLAPTLTTLHIVSSELDPGTEIVQWATDWVVGNSSYDNCGPISEFLVKVPSLGLGQLIPPVDAEASYSFTCADLNNYPQPMEVDIWARDVENNWTYSITTIELQDNVDPYCSSPSAFAVSGNIQNEESAAVEYVDVEVGGDINDITTTGDDGTFSFNLPGNSNYTITPERDDNILNGVTTFDLVLISKHILQVDLLGSPYKIIAADINHSGSITTIDLVYLRKVILFIDDEFPGNTSWRFVDAEFIFPDPLNPFSTSFPEVFTINGLSDDEVADFVGVKIGDVNTSAIPNDLTGSSDDRNADGELVFSMADQSLKAGETYQFDFQALDFDQVQGFQFTMSFDANAIEFSEVKAGELINISDANFGLHKLDEGIITASWNAPKGAQSVENGKALLSFSFTALEDGQLSDLISLNSRFTKAEGYDQYGLLELDLKFIDESGTIKGEKFELFQNQPNPFKEETVVGFNLPEGGKVTFKVFDISGRVIKLVEGYYSIGYNEISINRSELQSSGVLYYQLESGEHIAAKKMITSN